MPKQPRAPRPRRKASGINLAELKPEDFTPISKEKFGESLRKSVIVPKPKK
jgi:hypothetical protein